ncbi:multicomponent Na+:H+ antiporter subunit D [Kineococcus radiotolerans]|uniref:NADH dehydrogenase (Quinone) n=2 Tax=Kineococcus radiotolerans TaxID=131568 RepID=A6W3Z6_KINRD|nr:Na+/H+ antiporter subunit D [Kineococcus radiotolerans]ABS01535.1 NADH dehydrogenase (quinone) [Kineococcus radiotolerans SRS30216 = ATCC BAA-149]MBB2901337.1 multicomponent Na+:H+ antiporter subunit D [Kineococcus radiotolerans]
MTEWARILIPLPVVLPLFAAGLTLALARRPRAQRTISVSALSVVVLASVTMLVLTDRGSGTYSIDVGGWPARLGIPLVADRLSTLMLVVSSVVTLAVLLYSLAQGVADGEEGTPVSIYHPTYLVLSAGVSNAFLSGDLFNLYVGFEILLAASYILLTLGGTKARVRAGTTYVVVSLLSSMVFLTAIALVYAATGTVNMAELSLRLQEIDPDVRLVLHLLLLVGFGIKAAVFPLSAWLPDSYPTAPAPVTAVFAGLLTKVGVYAIIRTETLLFPGGEASTLLLWVSLATMVVGILGAVAQNDVKRLLSFTLVSHIGYMVFGIALGTAAGLSGAVFYVAHHITVQTTLFLVTGLVERHSGSTSLDSLGSLAKRAPLLAVLFFVPAMNLAGIPPFSGFLGKLGLLQAGVDVGTTSAYVLVAGGVLTSLLTLYAIAKVWNRAFWQEPLLDPEDDPRAHGVGGLATATEVGVRTPAGMVVPTAALVAVGVGITFVAGPLFGVADRAARDLLDRAPYTSTVLHDRVPEVGR